MAIREAEKSRAIAQPTFSRIVDRGVALLANEWRLILCAMSVGAVEHLAVYVFVSRLHIDVSLSYFLRLLGLYPIAGAAQFLLINRIFARLDSPVPRPLSYGQAAFRILAFTVAFATLSVCSLPFAYLQLIPIALATSPHVASRPVAIKVAEIFAVAVVVLILEAIEISLSFLAVAAIVKFWRTPFRSIGVAFSLAFRGRRFASSLLFGVAISAANLGFTGAVAGTAQTFGIPKLLLQLPIGAFVLALSLLGSACAAVTIAWLNRPAEVWFASEP